MATAFAGSLPSLPMNAASPPKPRARLPWWLLGLALSPSPALASSPVPDAGPGAFSWFQFLAPFHMVVLHLPIGLLSAVMLLEAWTWRRPSRERREVIGMMLSFGMVASLITVLLGFLRATDGEYDAITLGRHRAWGIAAVALMGVSWGLHRQLSKHPAPGGWMAFRLLAATSFMAMAVAGHHGGSLTHGSSFLTEHAPGALRKLLQASVSTPPAPSANTGPDATSRFDALLPVLTHKCVSCHGPEKQKGGLRLDQRDLALKPGKSGRPSVVPGDPGRSELARACLLSPSHDEAMPPDGKERLTDAELAALLAWIRDGAR